MIIEDTKEIREALTHLLTLEGYEVEAYEDAKEAMKALDHHHPKLILCDLMMPHNGWKIVDMLKKTKLIIAIPTIIMTASNEKVEGMKIIKKPFTIDTLLDTVKLHYNLTPSIQNE